MRDQNAPGATIERIYPQNPDSFFLIGGIAGLTGGHVKFMVFGARAGLHASMWFAMAARPHGRLPGGWPASSLTPAAHGLRGRRR